MKTTGVSAFGGFKNANLAHRLNDSRSQNSKNYDLNQIHIVSDFDIEDGDMEIPNELSDQSSENSNQEEESSRFDRLVFVRKTQPSGMTSNERASRSPRKILEDVEDEATVEEIPDGYESDAEDTSRKEHRVTRNKKVAFNKQNSQTKLVNNPEIEDSKYAANESKGNLKISTESENKIEPNHKMKLNKQKFNSNIVEDNPHEKEISEAKESNYTEKYKNRKNISFGFEKHRSSSKKIKSKEKAKDKSQNKSDDRNKFLEEFSEWK